MRRLAGTILLLCTGAALGAPQDYSALLDDAINAIDWNVEDEWAFTETSLQAGELWVGKHDPRLDEDERWTLVSVDGKEPTSRQRREYRHNKSEQGEDADDDDRVTAVVDAESLELIEETDEHWLFTFVPGEDEEAFVNSVDGWVRVRKDGHYVESIDIRNNEDIRPGFGTKITQFRTRILFGPATDDGPIVQKSLEVQVTGRAFLFIGFDEAEAITYSDFEHVRDRPQ